MLNPIFYVNLETGSDTARTALTTVSYANNGSGVVRCTKTAHGLITGSVVASVATNYNGTYICKKIDNDNVDLADNRAAAYMTVNSIPAVNDTFVIGSQTFTFKASRSTTGEVTISSDVNDLCDNIVFAIQTDIRATVEAETDIYGVVRVISVAVGTEGNTITFTSATSALTMSSSTLTGGSWLAYVSNQSGTLTPSGGANWADAFKTTMNGPTTARGNSAGATTRIAKSADPVSLGNGTWENSGLVGSPAAVAINGSSAATPIVITTGSNHNLVTGDKVMIYGHTTQPAANGLWKVTNLTATTYSLDGSVGVGAGAASGSMVKINSNVVELATAPTQTVHTMDATWTAAAGADTTVALVNNSTDGKEGGYCQRFTLDAAVQVSIKQAYATLTSTNYSSKQLITFWIKNSAAIVANNYQIKLCSDTLGATPVDTFDIPAIPSTGNWVALTLARSGGGNLGSAIQSVALYTGSVAPTASSNILLDNIEATTTAGINLNSVVSKNSAANGGTEPWYPIRSIRDKFITFDYGTASLNSAFRGYQGTSSTSTTYYRNCIELATMGTTVTTQMLNLQAGLTATIGGRTSFQFGYNTSTTIQDGHTYITGRNYMGYGIASIHTNSLSNRFSLFRFYVGLYINASSHYFNTIGNVSNNTNAAITGTSSASITINRIINVLHNYANNLGLLLPNGYIRYIGNIHSSQNGNGIIFTAHNTVIDRVDSIRNNGNYGISFSTVENIIFKSVGDIKYNSQYGVACTSAYGCVIKDATISNNNIGSITYTSPSNLNIENCLLGDSTEFALTVVSDRQLFTSTKHDQTADNHWMFTEYSTFNSLATTRPSGTGIMWKQNLTNTNQTVLYPSEFVLAKVDCASGSLVTIKAWCQKSHATNGTAQLVCKGGQIAGVSTEVTATKANDTNWEELTITFTPTADGVVEILGRYYYNATAVSYCYWEDMTISQA